MPTAIERKQSLAEITDDLIAWRDVEESLSPDDPDCALVRAKVLQLNAIHESKGDRYCGLIRWAENEDKQLGDEVKRINRRRAFLSRLADRLRANSLTVMITHGIDAIRGRYSSITLQPGIKRGVEITDESLLPDEFFDLVPEQIIPSHCVPNMQSIEEALQAGYEVPGARLKQGEPFVRIS